MKTRIQARSCYVLLVAASLSLIIVVGRLHESSAGQALADDEFRVAMKRAIPLAARIDGDVSLFLESVHPFGPLDLVVEKSPDAKYCDQIGNYFSGTMAAAAKVDEAAFKKTLNDFHCGPPCARARRDSLAAHLDAIRSLVTRFDKLRSTSVVALWPGGGYRIGSLAVSKSHIDRIKPSPMLGLIPWETVPLTDGLDVLFGRMQISGYEVEALLTEMRRLGIVALSKDEEGIRAVIKGSIGDNEAGLIFLESGSTPPQYGTRLKDGRQYVGVDKLTEGVYFYTSS